MHGGERRERNRGCLLVRKVLWDHGERGFLYCRVLCESADLFEGHPAVDPVACCEPGDVLAGFLDDSGEFIAHNQRHLVGGDEFDFTADDHVVERVDRRRHDLDQHFRAAGLRDGEVTYALPSATCRSGQSYPATVPSHALPQPRRVTIASPQLCRRRLVAAASTVQTLWLFKKSVSLSNALRAVGSFLSSATKQCGILRLSSFSGSTSSFTAPAWSSARHARFLIKTWTHEFESAPDSQPWTVFESLFCHMKKHQAFYEVLHATGRDNVLRTSLREKKTG